MTPLARAAAASLLLASCSSSSSSSSGACASLEGTYDGTYSVQGGDCPAGTTYDATSPTVHVTMNNGSFYLSAAGQSCTGSLDGCEISTRAGVCGGVTGLGAKTYPNVSRVAFGAGGSLVVSEINVMPASGKQCILQVSFSGQKTSN